MVSTQDLKILEKIQSQYQQAKAGRQLVSEALSSGNDDFSKSISNVRNAALWSIVGAITGYVVTFLLGIVFPAITHDSYITSELVGGALALAVLVICMIYFGFRAYDLKLTPNRTLSVLAFLFIGDIVFFEGLVSLMGLVFVIMALTKISSYRAWFDSFASKRKMQTKHSEITTSKTNILPIIITGISSAIIALVLGLIIGSVSHTSYDETYNDGYNYGKNTYLNSGYDNGVKSGYQQGFKDAQTCAIQIANEFDALGTAITTMDSCYRY